MEIEQELTDVRTVRERHLRYNCTPLAPEVKQRHGRLKLNFLKLHCANEIENRLNG
jgi:hypothetical protein